MTPLLKESLLLAIRDARAPIAAFSLGVHTLSDPAIRRRIEQGEWSKVKFAITQTPVISSTYNSGTVEENGYSLLSKPSVMHVELYPLSKLLF